MRTILFLLNSRPVKNYWPIVPLPYGTLKTRQDPGLSFGGQGERRRSEYRGAAGAEGVVFGRGCPLSSLRKFLDFFASEWYILRAF